MILFPVVARKYGYRAPTAPTYEPYRFSHCSSGSTAKYMHSVSRFYLPVLLDGQGHGRMPTVEGCSAANSELRRRTRSRAWCGTMPPRSVSNRKPLWWRES